MSTEKQQFDLQPDISIDLSDLEQNFPDPTQSPRPISRQHAPIWNGRIQRNHETLRKAVRRFWINGLYRDSLHTQLCINQGRLRLHPNEIPPPPQWTLSYQQADQTEIITAEPEEIGTIFNELNQQMIILGEAGAGKSTTLSILANYLLEQSSEESPRRPVIFNLCSWGRNQQRFEDWLVQELIDSYYMPQEVSRRWVANDELLLLLDGLDEVAEDKRGACVRAINQFRAAHLVGMAICCRTAEYQALNGVLDLNGAVAISPLTEEQIAAYIHEDEPSLSPLTNILATNPDLRALAQTPFMLTLMAFIQCEQPQALEDLSALNPSPNRSAQQHLLDLYIRTALQHRSASANQQEVESSSDSPVRLLQWLRWLANKMLVNDQALFRIEQLQQIRYENWPQRFLDRLIVLLSTGLYIGLLYGLFVLVDFQPIPGLTFGLLIGYLFHTATTSEKYAADTSVIESGGVLALILAAVVLIVLLVESIEFGFLTFVFSLFLWVFLRYFGYAGPAVASVQTATNNGTWRSLERGFRTGGAIWVLVGSLLTMLYTIAFGPIVGMQKGAIEGLIFGLTGGLITGFFSCINHVAKRTLLTLAESTPSNYARFLDQMASRLLLHKVGGGYIFAHRIILEHIAKLSDEDIKQLTTELSPELSQEPESEGTVE